MKTDLYTKVILTVIAFLLCIILFKDSKVLINPAYANEQASINGKMDVQIYGFYKQYGALTPKPICVDKDGCLITTKE